MLPTTIAESTSLARARWWTAEQCVVCAAFPGHSGVHYVVREVAAFLCSGWVRTLGEPRWVPLRGAFTARGHQIYISAHLPESRDVRQVDGLWFREQPQEPVVVDGLHAE
jgi:hypothetical protein